MTSDGNCFIAMLHRRRMVLFLTLLMGGPEVLLAQGAQADYDRAGHLKSTIAKFDFPSTLAVHWLPDGLWCRVATGLRTYEFVRVKFDEGQRALAFDHVRLAEALRREGLADVTAERLPLEALQFDNDSTSVSFQAAGRGWRFDVRENALVAAEVAARQQLQPISELPAGSRRTGASTKIVVRNQSSGDLQLWWLSNENERIKYERVAAGETLERQTYSGHIWLITDIAENSLGWFAARDHDNAIEVTDDLTREKIPLREDSRRRRNNARDSNLSPDGRYRAVLQDHNVHVVEVSSNEPHAVSADGTVENPYREIFWSPDSKKLAAIRATRVEPRQVPLVESMPKDQLQPKLHMVDYPKPGDPVTQRSVTLLDVTSQKWTPVADDLFSRQWSLSEFAWTPDSREFTFLFNQRGHQLLRVVVVNGETTEPRAVIEERSDTFVDYSQKLYLKRLRNGQELLWASERDGWNHLYLYDLSTGTMKQQITQGRWLVRSIEHVDEDRRQVWFRAMGLKSNEDPYHVHLARVNFDGSGLVVLTEGDGTHTVEYSPDRSYFVDTWSRADLPPVHELRSGEDGRSICVLKQTDWSELSKTGWLPPERFTAKGRDGMTDIYGLILRPSTFDPSKQYPVIESIYAGPHGAHVPKSFRAWSGQRELAELGFIVVQIDGMGTNWRGKAFHDVSWKNLKDAGFPDRIAWLHAAAATRPWMDLSRVGLYGGSAGGQNTLAGLLHHGDFYQVGVADCGCHDNRMDKLWWNEAWMGWPVDASYADNSNVTHAGKLRGKLLLIFGELDRNVDPSSTLQVVNALQKIDKDFELLVMTGTGHGAAETPYGNRRRVDFFVRHLLLREPRWQ